MRRIIVSVKLKDLIKVFLIFNVFVISLCFFLVGGYKNNHYSQFNKILPKQKYKNEIKNSGEAKNKDIKNMNLKNKKIKVYISEEKKVREIDLEEYVLGVVSGEMPASFEYAALQAQAIAARTYTVAHLEEFGGRKCPRAGGGDLCDTVHCQVYMNKEKRLNSWPKAKANELWKKLNKAISSTSGQVLVYNGELVMEPYYFSTSSGNTENAYEVFSNDIPYLRSVPSYGEEVAPKFKSEFTFTKSNIINSIKEEFGKFSLGDNLSKEIQVLSRSEAGSVKEIKIGNITMTGSRLRKILGLSSANFDIGFMDEKVCIKCKGYGHGVGMSQWGANIMAKSGSDYKQILTHYYKDTNIEDKD